MSTITSRSEITPGTYTVKIPFGANSAKRFRDAVETLKRVRRSEGCDATFDGGSKTWTIVIADTEEGRVFGASRLADAVECYSAIAERA